VQTVLQFTALSQKTPYFRIEKEGDSIPRKHTLMRHHTFSKDTNLSLQSLIEYWCHDIATHSL